LLLELLQRSGTQDESGKSWSNITARRSCRCAAAIRSPWAATARSRWATSSSRHRKKGAALYQGRILAGFAGGTADAFTLFERFEAKLEKHQGNCCARRSNWPRTGAPTAPCAGWRRCCRWPIVSHSLIITGNGDVLEPEHGIVAIGSGGSYAQSAARALLENTDLSPA
jgi:hypothetical protein